MNNATAAAATIERLKNLDTANMTPAKRAKLHRQLADLCRRYGIPHVVTGTLGDNAAR